jgi:hypothetical protein
VLGCRSPRPHDPHVGVNLELAIEASERSTERATADADKGVYSATGGFSGTPAKCVISVNRSHPPTGDYLEMVLAHEVWHCFEGQVLGLDRFWSDQRASWIIEGEAEWVGYALRPQAPADGWWEGYIDHPEYRLFARTYSAIGFYSHLTDSGIDTWQKLIPILQAGSNDEAFAVSGATSDRFVDIWASSYFGAKSLGAAWIMTGPGLPERSSPGRTRLEVSDGQASPFAAPAYTNGVFQLISQADVVTFAVTGHARLGDDLFDAEYLLNAGGSFRTKNGGCACPAGSTSAGPPLTSLDTTPMLAVSGGPDGTRGTATGQSLDQYCKPEAPKAEVGNEGHITAACPSGATVGHGATFQGAQRSGESTACGYYAPGERVRPGDRAQAQRVDPPVDPQELQADPDPRPGRGLVSDGYLWRWPRHHHRQARDEGERIDPRHRHRHSETSPRAHLILSTEHRHEYALAA